MLAFEIYEHVTDPETKEVTERKRALLTTELLGGEDEGKTLLLSLTGDRKVRVRKTKFVETALSDLASISHAADEVETPE